MSKKGKGKQQSKSKPKPRQRRGQLMGPIRQVGFGDVQRAYARMLADPCYGPMVTGLSTGPNGGVLARFRSTLPADSGSSGYGLIHWVPGIATSSSVGITNQRALFYGWPATTPRLSTAITCTWGNVHGSQPGMNFIDSGNNFASYRVQAACLRLRFTGAEMNRAGQWAAWNSGGGYIDPAQTVSPSLDNLMATAPDIMAVNNAVEVVWRPQEADMQPTDPYVDSRATGSRRGGITAFWAYAPSPTADNPQIIADLIAVMEMFPDYNVNNMVPNRTSRYPGMTSLDIPQVLDQAAPGWDVLHSVVDGAASMVKMAAMASSPSAGVMAQGLNMGIKGIAKMMM